MSAKAKRFGLRVGILVAACACALCAAIGVTGCASGVDAYKGAPSGMAAQYDGNFLSESDVAEQITRYRNTGGLSSDDSFKSYLLSEGMTVSDYRIIVINSMVLDKLIDAKAEALGVAATDAEAQSHLDSVKETVSMGDESVWTKTLESGGLTEEMLLAIYKTNLNQDAVCAKEVPTRDATDDEVLTYLQNNLAGTTQKHIHQLYFKGSDAQSRADACYAELQTAKSNGTLTTSYFEDYAKANSDEENVQSTGGSVGWTGSGLNDEFIEALEYMEVGDVSTALGVEDDEGLYIIYCDEDFTFPESSAMTSLDAVGAPDELMSIIKEYVALTAWSSDCSDYLARLLAESKVTYYPIPDGAAYNIALS